MNIKHHFSVHSNVEVDAVTSFYKCDRACKNRACGLKYTMSFDDTYLNAEIYYLDSVSSGVKPNKLSTNLENVVAIPYWNKKL